jgi:orotate phosphoribosyltransferase
MLYGPAYKGIPLVIATSIALAEHYQISAPYAFNRKEAKDHGEGGIIVGSSLQGKILILDDVISAGISISESIHLIHHHYAEPVAAMIALDRQEHNECHFNLPIFPILRFTDLVDYLATQPNMDAELHRMKLYQAQFNDT